MSDEFVSDELRAEHLAALVREKDGYEARAAGFESDAKAEGIEPEQAEALKEKAAALSARAKLVAGELKRLGAKATRQRSTRSQG